MLSKRLKELRLERGITQAELGRRIGVGQPVVAWWEAGSSTPRLPNLVKLAAEYGLTLDELCRTNGTNGRGK